MTKLARLLDYSDWFLAVVCSIVGIAVVRALDRPAPAVDVSLGGSIVPLFVALCLGLAYTRSRRRPENTILVFFVAFALRIITGFTLGYAYQGQDERILHGYGSLLGTAGFLPWVEFHSLTGILYWLFGANLLVPKILNALLGSILPFLAYDIASKIFYSERAARGTLYLSVFMPPLVLYSGMHLKEIPSAFLLVLTLWVLLVPCWSLALRVGAAVACALVISYLRSEWVILLLVITGAYLIFGDEPWTIEKLLSWRRWAPAAMVLLIIIVPLRSYVDDSITAVQNRLYIGAYAEWGTLKTADRSLTASFIDPANPWSPTSLLVQLGRAPFSPSPLSGFFSFSAQGVIDSLAGASLYFLFPLAFCGFLEGWRRGGVMTVAAAQLILLVISGMSLMFGLTIQRHAIPQFATLCVLSGCGLKAWHRHIWVIYSWAVISTLALVVYALTR